MVLWDGGETARGLRRAVAVLARAYSAKMNHLWGMRQNRPLLGMSLGGGVVVCCHALVFAIFSLQNRNKSVAKLPDILLPGEPL